MMTEGLRDLEQALVRADIDYEEGKWGGWRIKGANCEVDVDAQGYYVVRMYKDYDRGYFIVADRFKEGANLIAYLKEEL